MLIKLKTHQYQNKMQYKDKLIILHTSNTWEEVHGYRDAETHNIAKMHPSITTGWWTVKYLVKLQFL